MIALVNNFLETSRMPLLTVSKIGKNQTQYNLFQQERNKKSYNVHCLIKTMATTASHSLQMCHYSDFNSYALLINIKWEQEG